MNILIAKSKEECYNWGETSIIIDVLRTSTTLCTLLNRGKKEILLFSEASKAENFYATHTNFDVFSDETLNIKHEDNSPYLADKSSGRSPALVLSNEASKAALALRKSKVALVGGFCNFYTIADVVYNMEKDVLLVPASLFGTTDSVEDNLCAEALKDYIQQSAQPENALVEFGNTVRSVEFVKKGPKTAAKDLKISLKLDGLNKVPRLCDAWGNGYAICYEHGKEIPSQWLASKVVDSAVKQTVEIKKEEPTQSIVETMEEQEEFVGGASLKIAPKEFENPIQTETEPMPSKEDVSEKPENATLNGARNFLNKMVSSVKEEVSDAKQNAAQLQDNETIKQTKSRLKSFFTGLVQTVKEEKAELEQSLFKTDESNVTRATTIQHKSDDPFDALLKKVNESSENPIPTVQEEITVPNANVETEVTKKSESVTPSKKKKAVVLFSGGLDSTTCLYWAINQGYECEALTVSYGQRHDREILAAQMIARNLGIKHHLITLNLPWLVSSSLVDKKQDLPNLSLEEIAGAGIPSTYVPGRNLMFLAIAGSLLDTIDADAIIAGPNAIDFSGYPDCTPAFFKSAADALNRGTKRGVQEGIEVLAPLMRLSKTEIVKLAASLNVPFELTWSCYAGGKKPCGQCDSCKLRAKGFAEAGVRDTSLD